MHPKNLFLSRQHRIPIYMYPACNNRGRPRRLPRYLSYSCANTAHNFNKREQASDNREATSCLALARLTLIKLHLSRGARGRLFYFWDVRAIDWSLLLPGSEYRWRRWEITRACTQRIFWYEEASSRGYCVRLSWYFKEDIVAKPDENCVLRCSINRCFSSRGLSGKAQSSDDDNYTFLSMNHARPEHSTSLWRFRYWLVYLARLCIL